MATGEHSGVAKHGQQASGGSEGLARFFDDFGAAPTRPVEIERVAKKRSESIETKQETNEQSKPAKATKRPLAEKSRRSNTDADDMPVAQGRLGRPPGVKDGSPKRKASFYVHGQLIEEYRERAWQERCQPGELVERALREYASRLWDWNERAATKINDESDGAGSA